MENTNELYKNLKCKCLILLRNLHSCICFERKLIDVEVVFYVEMYGERGPSNDEKEPYL